MEYPVDIAKNKFSTVKANVSKLLDHEKLYEEKYDIVEFGVYEQDKNPDNGKEPIKWLVLKNDEDGILLLSMYVLDFKQFDDPKEIEADKKVSWYETSYIRKWLNEDFYNEAFSSEEKNSIQPTTRVRKHPGESQCVTSTDSVFLLEWSEIPAYLHGDYNLQLACTPEHATFGKGDGEKGFFEYLTCSEETEAQWFTAGTYYGNKGTVWYNEDVGIRPALTLKSIN